MDQDEAQKRIADLEHQIAEARGAGGGAAQGSAIPPPPAAFPPPGVWQQPQGQIAGAGYGRQPRPRSLPRRLWTALLAIVAVVVLLALFGSAAYNYYAYRSGTPTTATIEHYSPGCIGSSHPGVTGTLIDTNPLFDYFSVDKCTGAWHVGDASQSGPIQWVDRSQPTGSSWDVRVFGGKAYTTASGKHSLLWMIGIGVPGFLIAVIAWWRRRTGRSSFGWLRGIARFGEIFGDN